MNREPIKIVRDILINCMGLANDQIFIYDQNFKLPKTSGLFIVLKFNSSNSYSSTNRFIPAIEGVEGAQEDISNLRKEEYSVNIMSRDSSARTRKEEVTLSLNSNYSKNQQALYQFQIPPIDGDILDVSELEGAAVINRFAINISLLAHYNKVIDTTFYDDFTNQINIE